MKRAAQKCHGTPRHETSASMPFLFSMFECAATVPRAFVGSLGPSTPAKNEIVAFYHATNVWYIILYLSRDFTGRRSSVAILTFSLISGGMQVCFSLTLDIL
jgi:hypothetical protein